MGWTMLSLCFNQVYIHWNNLLVLSFISSTNLLQKFDKEENVIHIEFNMDKQKSVYTNTLYNTSIIFFKVLRV